MARGHYVITPATPGKNSLTTELRHNGPFIVVHGSPSSVPVQGLGGQWGYKVMQNGVGMQWHERMCTGPRRRCCLDSKVGGSLGGQANQVAKMSRHIVCRRSRSEGQQVKFLARYLCDVLEALLEV